MSWLSIFQWSPTAISSHVTKHIEHIASHAYRTNWWLLQYIHRTYTYVVKTNFIHDIIFMSARVWFTTLYYLIDSLLSLNWHTPVNCGELIHLCQKLPLLWTTNPHASLSLLPYSLDNLHQRVRVLEINFVQ